MTEPTGPGWFAIFGLGGLVVAAIAVERWWYERQRNRELVRALRVYLRDAEHPRDDRDRRAAEIRRQFLGALVGLKTGELAPEWPPAEQRPLKAVRGGKR